MVHAQPPFVSKVGSAGCQRAATAKPKRALAGAGGVEDKGKPRLKST